MPERIDEQMPVMRMLDHILTSIAVEIDAFAVCEIAPDTRLQIDRLAQIEVHCVLSGALYLTVETGAPLLLPRGSVVIVPPGHAHGLAASPAHSVSVTAHAVCTGRVDGMVSLDASRGAKDNLTILCGRINADATGGYGAFERMPGPIIAGPMDHHFVRDAFMMMAREVRAPGTGSRAMCASLMRACLILVLRRHLSEHGFAALPGLFGDPSIGAIVAMILEHPERPCTLSSLAAACGRGRSTFARDFTRQVGLPAMSFVMRVRLDRAREALTGSRMSVTDIARHYGFASQSHFSTAFRHRFGMTPNACRRNGSSCPDARRRS